LIQAKRELIEAISKNQLSEFEMSFVLFSACGTNPEIHVAFNEIIHFKERERGEGSRIGNKETFFYFIFLFYFILFLKKKKGKENRG